MAIASLKCKQMFIDELHQESSFSPEKTFCFAWDLHLQWSWKRLFYERRTYKLKVTKAYREKNSSTTINNKFSLIPLGGVSLYDLIIKSYFHKRFYKSSGKIPFRNRNCDKLISFGKSDQMRNSVVAIFSNSKVLAQNRKSYYRLMLPPIKYESIRFQRA